MKKIIFLSMIYLVSSFLFSYEYIMNTNPTGIGSLTGTTKVITLTAGNWLDGYYDLAVPAINQFYYYGKRVTHLRISTKGYVVLGHGSASGDATAWNNGPIPKPSSSPNNMVAPLWDDYALDGCIEGAGEIWYRIYNGPSNNNYIIVEWRGVRYYGALDTAYTFACAFCSSDNPYYANGIAFHYADVDGGNATHDNGITATVGIENSVGTVGEQFSCNEAIVTNGMKIVFTPFVPIYGSTIDQYLTDGKPDAVVFRPSDGNWYIYGSDGATGSFHFGQKGDVALPGDFDGDGDADECVFRPSNGHWYGYTPNFDIQWGTSGDIPAPADYNGDGIQDIAVFRPSNGYWYVYISGSGTTYSWQWGQPGDIPLPADYDNDNYADIAVYRPANGTWYIRKSSDWGIIEKQWGAEGDIPLPGNFNTGLYSTLTVFRPSNGYWYYLDHVNDTSNNHKWGQDGDVPVPADQNNGGLTDASVFRPGEGKWYLASPTYLPSSFQWGTLGDKPRFRRSFLTVAPSPTSGGPDW